MKINDLVLLVNPMQSYSGYYSFFEKNDIPIDVSSRYAYYESPKYLDVYRVIYSIAETDSNMVVIEEVGMAKSTTFLVIKNMEWRQWQECLEFLLARYTISFMEKVGSIYEYTKH